MTKEITRDELCEWLHETDDDKSNPNLEQIAQEYFEFCNADFDENAPLSQA